MDISVDHISDLKKVCRLFLDKQAYSQKINAKLVDFQKNARIKGFRAGKVKPDFIKRRYGKAIEQEVVSDLMENAWKDILNENKFQPVSQPKADIKGLEEDGFRAEFSFEIAPKVVPIEDNELNIELIEAKVEKDHIDKIIDDLKHQYGDTTDKEEKSELGNVVIANILRTLESQEEPEEMKEQSILLDNDKTLSTIVEQLTGVQAGDTKEFTHTYADDWHDKSVAGKTMHFKIDVSKVQVLEKCSLEKVKESVIGEEELDDSQIVEKIGQFAQAQADQRVFEKNKDTVLQYLLDSHQFELPESLETEAKQGTDENVDDRLKSLRLGFIVDSYSASWGIKVDQIAIEKQVHKMASQFGMAAKDLLPLISKNKEIQQNIHYDALLDSLINAALEKITTEKKVLGYDEVMK